MVPKLRFKNFKKMEEKKLIDFAPLQRGYDLPVSQIESGDYPVVFSNGILKKHRQYKVKGPGVVTGRSGTIGKVTYVNKDFWPHNTSLFVTNFFNNVPKYVYYYYQHIDFSKFATGSGVPTLNRNDLHSLDILEPEIDEQTKIADFLSSVDERITLLNQQYDLLCQYKKGMMQKIFSQEVRFKDENGETFPEWIQTSLGTISKAYDGTHQTPNYVEFGVPFYSVEHVTADNFDDTKYISEDVFEQESKRVSIQQGDILMTRIGDIGTVKYINWIPRASFYVSLSLIKVRESFDSKMISYCMQSDFFQKELHEKTIHVAFPKKINLGEISNCRIKMPASKKEQTKIVIFLSAIDDKIAAKKAELDKLKTWKQGLLQQMFV
ncbi:restriction endonuclease subunit S [Franconibacter pulveris]|uniref:restriction endonuclease subunit S n=1 Tax=Franconibacter pulveris TaxID=435910 RepID=UPI0004973491|nr:restriction endonuclease subunit S [Franconibacter pulveris]